MRRIQTCSGLLCALLLLCIAQAPVSAAAVARVVGESIDAEHIAGDLEARARALAGIVYQRVTQDYVRRNGLTPTAAEIAELVSYNRELARQDRAQRARKEQDLGRLLAADDLPAQQRARAEDFRNTLQRLAGYDAAADRAGSADPGTAQAQAAMQVELWKLNKSLYQSFGGAVALTRTGPHPYGALAALLQQYASAGVLEIVEPELRRRVWQIVTEPPAGAVAAERIDFTPPWKHPLPSGYY